jgi:hypothetical protein
MNRIQRMLIVCSVLLLVVVSGCPKDGGGEEKHESARSTVTRSEHGGEGRGEHDRDLGGEGEGEESGTEYALNQTYDQVRNGARLILAYDAQSKSFTGTVENTTSRTLDRVRVEVHLSNGKEVGPTTPVILSPGEKQDVKLTVTSTEFTAWSAHAEVGNEEHAGGEHSGEGSGEHGSREGRGEHN